VFANYRLQSACGGGHIGGHDVNRENGGPQMSLTDSAVRSAKPAAKPTKLYDERGLFLLVQPSGGKLWRLKYRFDGKEKKLSLGRYPEVSLREARARRDAARSSLANGVDPIEEQKAAALLESIERANTFAAVAEEYLDKATKEGREAVTIKKSRWLLSLMTPAIGHKPIAQISPAELLQALRSVEAKGHHETARRMRSFAGRVFRYAVATSRAVHDPSSVLKDALITPRVKHHSAIIDERKFAALLRAIDGYDGQPMTQLALRILPHVFARPGELRQAEWTEVDLEKGIWSISAAKMKMRIPHEVPLSRQVIELFQQAKVLTGKQRYIFSSLYPGKRPMSENTINAALRRLGYSGDEMTAHGFRASASTLLNESGLWSADGIERALAHYGNGTVRSIYHRGTHWEERKAMAQWWSDHIDTLKARPHGQ
jgi:integrase